MSDTVTHVRPGDEPTALCGHTIEHPDRKVTDDDPACGACLRLVVEAYEACLADLNAAHDRLDHVLSVVTPPGTILVPRSDQEPTP